jgi:hypothetical protein
MYASLMPRRARIAPGEIIYHALNRANGRSQLGERGTNRSRGRSAAEVREPRYALRHGNLEDTDCGYARIEIHTSAPRQT